MLTKEEIYMQRCLQLAQLGEGHVAPNPMVGAVLVYQDRIIGEGYHRQYGQPHAEVNCINSVQPEDQHLIDKSTIYVSLEPCAHFGKTPPCADLIIRNYIPKVIVGCRDPFEAVDGKGIEKLKAANIEVEMSTIEHDCIFLNRRFFTFHKKKRPYIILKWARTADGSIAYKNQEKANRLYISNETTNRLVHKWRHDEAAILIGTQTAILDNPSLTNRLWHGKSPIRLVIDKKEIIPADYNIFNKEATTILFTEKENKVKENIQYVFVPINTDYIDLILEYCYQNNIQSILVEGGAQLLQSFIDKDLWDETRIITNETLRISNGLKAPNLLQNISSNNSFQIENNRVDMIFHPHLKEL